MAHDSSGASIAGWASRTATQRCARCGTPATDLTTFTCTGCGHDVRERGFVAWTRGSPAATLANVSTLMLLVAILAGIGEGVLVDTGIVRSKTFGCDVSYWPTA